MKEAEFDIRLTAAELYVFSMHHKQDNILYVTTKL